MDHYDFFLKFLPSWRYFLPAALLAIAAELIKTSQAIKQSRDFVIVDVGAFAAHFSHTALALWDAISATQAAWPKIEGELSKDGLQQQVALPHARAVPSRAQARDRHKDMCSLKCNVIRKIS